MAAPSVAPIESLGVDPVQSMHRPRKLLAPTFDNEVEVGAEQAPGEDANLEELQSAPKQPSKRGAIVVVDKDHRPTGSA